MTSPLPHPPSDSSPLLLRGRPQFGMRTLFLFMTGCCVLFALVGLMGQLWALAAAWLILMTAAHVAGNVWGTRLRRKRGMDAAGDRLSVVPGQTAPLAVNCAPPTRLQERAALGWTRVVVSALCAMVGGGLGVAVLWLVTWGRMGLGSLLIAGVSAAVIGGFLGFLATSFLEVALRAWSEAARHVTPGSPFAPAGARRKPGRARHADSMQSSPHNRQILSD